MEKAIVFYCKGCGELFFAAVKNERNIKDSKKEIIQYLAEGHKMEEIDADKVNVALGRCVCRAEKPYRGK